MNYNYYYILTLSFSIKQECKFIETNNLEMDIDRNNKEANSEQ